MHCFSLTILLLCVTVFSFVVGSEGQKKEHCSAKRQKLLAENELVVGRFIPTCDENGNYQPLQTYGSTGERWCVDVKHGNEVAGTRVSRTQPDPVCSKENCSAKRQKLQAANKLVVGRFIPTCDENGNYQPIQRYGSTGERWCVDVKSGKEVPRTRVKAGKPDPNCP